MSDMYYDGSLDSIVTRKPPSPPETAEGHTEAETPPRRPGVSVTRNLDRTLSLNWPASLYATEVTRDVLADLVMEINALRAHFSSPLPPPPPTMTTAEVLADLRAWLNLRYVRGITKRPGDQGYEYIIGRRNIIEELNCYLDMEYPQ